MKKFITLAALISCFSSAYAANSPLVKLVYDGTTPESLSACIQQGITPEDLQHILILVDKSKMINPGQGFPEIAKSEVIEGDFRFRNYFGLQDRCGGYLNQTPITLNGKPFYASWMAISSPYNNKICTNELVGSIFLVKKLGTNSNSKDDPTVCAVKLKSVNY